MDQFVGVKDRNFKVTSDAPISLLDHLNAVAEWLTLEVFLESPGLLPVPVR